MQVLQRVFTAVVGVLVIAGRYSRGVRASGQVTNLDEVSGELFQGGTATDLEASDVTETIDGDSVTVGWGTDGNNNLGFK